MADAYPDLIADLFHLDPPIFVFGGWAEDALLHGRQTRPHSDVDVLVARRDVEARLELFHKWGFGPFEVYYEVHRGEPVVLNGARGGVHIELGIYETDTAGDDYFVVEAQPSGDTMRIYLPDDRWAHPPPDLEGAPIRTVSPLAMYQIREGLVLTDAFGGEREGDSRQRLALTARFFPDTDPDDLRPRIEPDGR